MHNLLVPYSKQRALLRWRTSDPVGRLVPLVKDKGSTLQTDSSLGMEGRLRAVQEQLLTLGYAVVDDALVDHADSIHGMLCRLQSAQAFRQHRFAFKSSTAAPPQIFSKPHIFEAELQDEVVRAVTPDLIGLLQQLDLPHAANAAFTELGLHPGNDGVQGVTVKLQLNLGQGGCFPAHFDNAGPPSKRRLSILCYFNPEWTEQCGGELELFPWLCPPALIPPKHGRIVLFQSDRVLHAVRPSFARRFCLTVWVDGQSNSDASMNIRVPAHATSDEALTDLVRSLGPSQRLLSRAVYAEEYTSSLQACMGATAGHAEMVRAHEAHCAQTESNATLARLVKVARRMKAESTSTNTRSSVASLTENMQDLSCQENHSSCAAEAQVMRSHLKKRILEHAIDGSRRNEGYHLARFTVTALDGNSLRTVLSISHTS